MRRVAITAAGSINALGTGVERFAEGLRAGRCAIGPLSVIPDLGFRSRSVAEVRDLALPGDVAEPLAELASRSTKLALVAALEAWRSGGLERDDARRTAIVVGTTTGGMSRGEENYRRLLSGKPQEARLSGWLEAPVAAPTEAVAQALGCAGPRLTVSTACSSGAHALGIAADWIRAGRAETAVAGGVDGLCLMTYSGFDALHALDERPCRPFDRTRAGLSLGEGAALFVLEDWEHASARGVRPLAELVAYGTSSDAHHLTQPRPDGAGAVLAIRNALERGGVLPEEIDYVNAHGTGTPLNDVVETRAIKTVLGARAYQIPVSSTKSMVGHCLGAAGAVELLASIIALREQFAPPTATLTESDPDCDLDFVPGAARPAAIRTVLSNSYGFGGNNCAIVVRAAEV